MFARVGGIDTCVITATVERTSDCEFFQISILLVIMLTSVTPVAA